MWLTGCATVTIDPFRTRIVSIGKCVIYYDKSLDVASLPPSATWFDPVNPSLQAKSVDAGGRAAAWFVEIGAQAGVLRHYRRGGLAARFLRDQYLWTGAARTRAFSEFSIMQSLWLAGLSVPQPLAAAVWRQGIIYRAALITARVPGAIPLAQVSDPELWAQAGRVIAKMHGAKIWHADLNVFNVLVDQELRVWLIDFDRAKAGHVSAVRRAENLARLLRSLRKVCPDLEHSCWPVLIKAYALQEQAMAEIGGQ